MFAYLTHSIESNVWMNVYWSRASCIYANPIPLYSSCLLSAFLHCMISDNLGSMFSRSGSQISIDTPCLLLTARSDTVFRSFSQHRHRVLLLYANIIIYINHLPVCHLYCEELQTMIQRPLLKNKPHQLNFTDAAWQFSLGPANMHLVFTDCF